MLLIHQPNICVHFKNFEVPGMCGFGFHHRIESLIIYIYIHPLTKLEQQTLQCHRYTRHCYWDSNSYLQSVTFHMGSHSVTCYPAQVNTPRLNPSHAGWYSIYLVRRDGRLSWLSWLDSALAGSRTFWSRVQSSTSATTKTTVIAARNGTIYLLILTSVALTLLNVVLFKFFSYTLQSLLF